MAAPQSFERYQIVEVETTVVATGLRSNGWAVADTQTGRLITRIFEHRSGAEVEYLRLNGLGERRSEPRDG